MRTGKSPILFDIINIRGNLTQFQYLVEGDTNGEWEEAANESLYKVLTGVLALCEKRGVRFN